MKEFHGEKRYKDYLLKRYSISREGHLMKDTYGEVYRIRPKKEGRDYYFVDGVTDLKIDALRFAVLYHYDIWDSVHQLRLKDGDPGNLRATNIITKRQFVLPSSIVIVISYLKSLMLKLNRVLLAIIIFKS